MGLWSAGLGVLGAFCSVAAHPRRPLRTHIPHLVMAGAMLAMTTPRADPLGPLGWSLVFLLLAATALRSAVRKNPPVPFQLSAANDVTGMACLVITMLMPHGHAGTGHAGTGHATPDMTDTHHGALLSSLLIVLWITGRLVLFARRIPRTGAVDRASPRRLLEYAGELAMIASMGLMAA